METAVMTPKGLLIRRPHAHEWPRILDILETVNFHRIGGPEMPSFPLEDCFVAEEGGHVVGVAGYRVLSPHSAKTTLLAVHPDHRTSGAGEALQRARMDHLRSLGVRTLTTNADDPRVIRWYERRFGYRKTGATVPKQEAFGRADKDQWITLEARL